MIAAPPLGSGSADLDFLRPVSFQPFEFDFEDPIVETRLDFVRIDPEGQLDDARKTAIGAFATLPVEALLSLLWLALAFKCQHVVLQIESYVIAGHTRQFGRYDDAIVTKPDVDRRKIARCCRTVSREQAAHLALHSPQFEKWVEPHSRKF